MISAFGYRSFGTASSSKNSTLKVKAFKHVLPESCTLKAIRTTMNTPDVAFENSTARGSVMAERVE